MAMTIDAAPPASRGSWTKDRAMLRAGWLATGLFTAFMTADSVLKIAELPVVLETQAQIGWPAELSRAIGVLELALIAVYLNRRTSLLGAVLLTGLFGATVAAHVRIGSPLLTHAFFGIYLAILAWAGLWLRDPRLRQLFPIDRSAER